MAKSVPAILLDRDGTINVGHGHVHEIDELEFIDGATDAMRELKKMGYALIIVTSQSGIARGKFTEAQFETLTEWMGWSLADRDVELDGIYYCPHHPQGTVEEYRQACDCRKPHPGMFISARDFLYVDMATSYMVGDKIEDMQVTAAANVDTKVLTRTEKPVTPEAENATDLVINSLADLPMAIKKQQGQALWIKGERLKQKCIFPLAFLNRLLIMRLHRHGGCGSFYANSRFDRREKPENEG